MKYWCRRIDLLRERGGVASPGSLVKIAIPNFATALLVTRMQIRPGWELRQWTPFQTPSGRVTNRLYNWKLLVGGKKRKLDTHVCQDLKCNLCKTFQVLCQPYLCNWLCKFWEKRRLEKLYVWLFTNFLALLPSPWKFSHNTYEWYCMYGLNSQICKFLSLQRSVLYFVHIDLEHMQKAQMQLLYYDIALHQCFKFYM